MLAMGGTLEREYLHHDLRGGARRLPVSRAITTEQSGEGGRVVQSYISYHLQLLQH
jgi:hypothetical protein